MPQGPAGAGGLDAGDMERNRLPQRGGRRARASGNATLLVMAVAAIAAALALWFWLERSAADAVSASSNPDKNEYAYSAAAGGQLFRSTPGRGNAFTPTPTTDAPPDPIRISRDAARQAVSSGVLQVTLPNRTTYPVRFERQETAPSGDWTFVGRVNTRIGKLAAVITFGRAGVFGVLPAPDGRMLHIVTNHGQAFIQPAGGLVPVGMPSSARVRDIALPKSAKQAPSPATNAPGAHSNIRNNLIPHTAIPSAKPAAGAPTPSRITRRTSGVASARAVAAAAEVRIRVLGLYTSDLVSLRGSSAAAESEFTNLIAITNQAHIDSGTVARFDVAGLRQVNYDPSQFSSNALSDIQQNALPGIDLNATRNALAADLVAMLRPYVAPDPNCGIAYINGAHLNAEYPSADYGFSVTATESCGPLVMAHEIGHNLGSHHDIYNSDDIYGAYPFSYGFRQDGPPAFATVMAYAANAQSWIGYFSNPGSTSCLGARCGVADQADNVRSINLMAPRISRFRDAPGTISVWDAQPMVEQDELRSSLNFEVRLASPAPSGGVRFDIATDGVTATPGSDYVGLALVDQVIPEGETSYWFQVEVLNDSIVEEDEAVNARLSNVRGATLFDAIGRGVIRNDDPRTEISGRVFLPGGTPWAGPAFSISACSVMQTPPRFGSCDSSFVAADGSYSIGAVTGSEVTLELYPPDPYAQQSVELGVVHSGVARDIELVRAVVVSGRVRWPAGEPVPSGDLRVSMQRPYRGVGLVTEYQIARAPDYAFRFSVFPGSPVTLGVETPPKPYVSQLLELGSVSTDVTRNIELRRVPSVAIGHATVNEMEGRWSWTEIRVMLSAPAPAGGVHFVLATVDGSAMSDNDYSAVAVELDIPEGHQFATRQAIYIHDDSWEEPDETFSITARNLVGAWLPANGVVRILNDDGMPEPDWVFADFTEDGTADIIWRNPSTGGVSRWDGPAFGWITALDRVDGSSWKIAGIGDFDNNRISDLLWRNSNTGRNTIWLSGDARIQRPVSTVGDAAWRVAGVGDFNGDRRSDILWRHARSGSNSIWKSGNSATLQKISAVTNPDWIVAGIGDFDGNNRDDILWRNKRTGANVIWNEGNRASQRSVTAVTNTGWAVAGVGDFDADGQSDVLWRDGKTGANVIWLSADSSKQRAVTKVTNLDWQVEAVADYNGDGVADLLWRNHRLGSNAVWLSANSRTQQAVSAVHPSWQVAP